MVSIKENGFHLKERLPLKGTISTIIKDLHKKARLPLKDMAFTERQKDFQQKERPPLKGMDSIKKN